ncbi:ryanodine receptor [Nephila pilipes]|uniref:Ryanodine receptor n=1 Tax=Nephila pilipes TaxID=299642 RepID=A0A8X6P1A9_NEPPI|nr:ryanodine receptor [Nephila pilipes]
MVTSEHLNSLLKNILNLIRRTVGEESAPWMVNIAAHAGQIVINSSEELLLDPVLPLAEKICSRAVAVFHKEESMRGYLKSATEDTSQVEGQLQDEFSLLVRDVYAFYPLLIKYVDLQRAHWLKHNIKEAEAVYNYVAQIFNIWSKSQAHNARPTRIAWQKLLSTSKKRIAINCLRSVPLYNLRRHRAINIFLQIFKEMWLEEENTGQEQLIENLTQSFEDAETKKEVEEEEEKPDRLSQLIVAFCRNATTEQSGHMSEDDLYMHYADIFSKSCGGADEDEEEEEGEEEGPSIHEQEMEKQKLLFQQSRLANRGVAEMTLLYISACKGVQSPMTMNTLRLGISILKGGNVEIQKIYLSRNYFVLGDFEFRHENWWEKTPMNIYDPYRVAM